MDMGASSDKSAAAGESPIDREMPRSNASHAAAYSRVCSCRWASTKVSASVVSQKAARRRVALTASLRRPCVAAVAARAQQLLPRRGPRDAAVRVTIRAADHVQQKIHWTPIQGADSPRTAPGRSRPHRRLACAVFFSATDSPIARGLQHRRPYKHRVNGGLS